MQATSLRSPSARSAMRLTRRRWAARNIGSASSFIARRASLRGRGCGRAVRDGPRKAGRSLTTQAAKFGGESPRSSQPPNPTCRRRRGLSVNLGRRFGVPAHNPLTQTVETVEKVSCQKLFLKSGTETLKSVWFLFFRTTFWQHFGSFSACCGRFL